MSSSALLIPRLAASHAVAGSRKSTMPTKTTMPIRIFERRRWRPKSAALVVAAAIEIATATGRMRSVSTPPSYQSPSARKPSTPTWNPEASFRRGPKIRPSTRRRPSTPPYPMDPASGHHHPRRRSEDPNRSTPKWTCPRNPTPRNFQVLELELAKTNVAKRNVAILLPDYGPFCYFHYFI